MEEWLGPVKCGACTLMGNLVRGGEGELVVSDGGAKARRDAGEAVEQSNLYRVVAEISTRMHN